MAARKKSSTRRKAATRKPGSGKRTTKKRQPAPPKAPARKAARPASLAERVSELVEQTAAGALRRVVEAGGREIAAWLPDASDMRRQAGSYVRELREVAGLTLDELAEAVEVSDRSVLESVENGTATLSFELILRLAAVLARHDPLPFVSRMARTYNPLLWELLEDWGIGRLPLQLERERQFVNILRSHDEARLLADDDFDQVLAFTRSAFETALHFRLPEEEAEE